MDSRYFFGMVGQFETNRIQAYQGAIDSSALHQVPEAFGVLLQSIITIFHQNLDKFCQPDQKLLLIGLQPLAIKYYSDYPIEKKRIFSADDSRAHFCCTLEYMRAGLSQPANMPWQDTRSILIDFTTGEVMDRDFFLARIMGQDSGQDKVLGVMDEQQLAAAWQRFWASTTKHNPRQS